MLISLSKHVISSRVGYTASGEVLNCNTYDVGLHAAIEVGADKLIYMHTDDNVGELALPRWLPLGDAQDMLMAKLQVRLRLWIEVCMRPVAMC